MSMEKRNQLDQEVKIIKSNQEFIKKILEKDDILYGIHHKYIKFFVQEEIYQISDETYATKDDGPYIISLMKENMQEIYEKSWGWDQVAREHELYSPGSIFFKLFGGDTLVGYVHFKFEDFFGEVALYIYDIQIDRHYQRKGIGTKLLATLQQCAQKYNVSILATMVFNSNTSGRQFFEKNGFVLHKATPQGDAEHPAYQLYYCKPLD